MTSCFHFEATITLPAGQALIESTLAAFKAGSSALVVIKVTTNANNLAECASNHNGNGEIHKERWLTRQRMGKRKSLALMG